jgi:hypothetical protein
VRVKRDGMSVPSSDTHASLTGVQELVAELDSFWRQGKRIAITDCTLVCTDGETPYLELTKSDFETKMSAGDAGPLQRHDYTKSSRQLEALLAYQPPLWSSPAVTYDMAEIVHLQLQPTPAWTMLTNALQNIAQALLRLRHYELALAYALAAVRLQPAPSPKALFRATFAAAHMCQVMSSLYLLQLVRCYACRNSLGSMEVACDSRLP